tara:strand:- start:6785 stop:7144 length:360 start_codon:yes stop_codon:yes gene_type:complete
MRYLVFTVLFFVITTVNASFSNKTKYEKEGDLVKVTNYHDNGSISQIGYLKNNKLHGEWISYNENGAKQTIGNYISGKKNGKWLFWNSDNLIEAEFKNNRLIKSIKWSSDQIAEYNNTK